jgi:hypothetical protein
MELTLSKSDFKEARMKKKQGLWWKESHMELTIQIHDPVEAMWNDFGNGLLFYN